MTFPADIPVDQVPVSNQIDNATTILGSIWDPIAQNYTTSNLSVVDIGAFMIGYNNLVVAVNGANPGEIPLLDANGQLVSSGVKIDDSVTLTQNLWSAAKTQAAITQQFLNTPSLPPASVASTANVASLTGLSTIDGYALLANDIILLKNQTSLDNGFWRVSSGAWVRQYFDGSSFADVTTQFNYAALGTNGGVVNVLNGTANRNLQFQLAVSNPTAPFGATTVFVTALTKLPVASPVNLFVDSSIGNDSNFTGAQSFPFASLSKAYSSISTTPCTLNLSGNTAYSSAVSWGKVNVTIQGNNLSSNGGTQTISAQQTLPAASRYIHFTNITFNTGATAPFAFASGALCSNEFKNITINSFAADWLGLNAGCQNFIRLNNIAFTTPGINAINLPAFTNTFAIYVDRQDTFCGMLLFTGTGSVNTTIYVNAGIPEANVRIPSSFLGTVIWLSPAFAFRLGSVSSPNGLITNQTSLTAILSHTATTGYDGFYVISGFFPTQFSRGAIIGKQTVAGVGTSVWLARSFGYAGPMLTDASGQYLVPVTASFDWSAVAFGGGSSSMPNFTLATRPTTPNVPYFNSTLQLAEYYDGTNYRPLEDVVTVRAMLTAAPSGGNTSGAGMYVDTSASPPSILYWDGTAATTAYPFASAPRLINDGLNTYSRGSSAWTQLGSASVPSFTLAARPTTTGLIYANTTLGVTEYFDGSAYHPLEEVITVNGLLGAAPTGANASGLYVDTSASPPSIIYWDGSTVTVAYGFATAPRLISDGTDIWSRGLYAWAKLEAGGSGALPSYAIGARPTAVGSIGYNTSVGVVEEINPAGQVIPLSAPVCQGVLTAASPTPNASGLWVNRTGGMLGSVVNNAAVGFWDGSAWTVCYEFGYLPASLVAGGAVWNKAGPSWVLAPTSTLPAYAFASRPTTANLVYLNSTFGVVEFYDGSDYRAMSGTLEVEDVLTAAPVTGTTPAGLYVDYIAPFNIVYWNGSASFSAYAFASAPEIVRTAAGDLYSRGASTWGVVGAGGAAPIAFAAQMSAGNQPGVNAGQTYIVNFDVVEHDTTGGFASGKFTAQVAGIYDFAWSCVTNQGSSATGEIICYLTKNGASLAWANNQDVATTHYNGFNGSALAVSLAVGDVIDIRFYGNGENFSVNPTSANPPTRFAGHLVTAQSSTAGATATVAQYARYTCPSGTSQALSLNYPIKFTQAETNLGTAITLNAAGDQITLQPGYTYRLRGAAGAFVTSSTPARGEFRWYNGMTGLFVGNRIISTSAEDGAFDAYHEGAAEVTITPTIPTIMQLRVITYINAVSVGSGDTQPWFEAEAIAAPSVVPSATATAPTITVLKSGAGTYTPPAGASYLRVRGISAGSGGNGGGSGGPSGGGDFGQAGGNTVFGPLTLPGASPGGTAAVAPTLPAGWRGQTQNGLVGSFGSASTVTGVGPAGGVGASTPLGGGGPAGSQSYSSQQAAPNSGAGGGGGGSFGVNGQTNIGGQGGNSGAYAEFVIPVPTTNYSYSVGSGGAGGNGGTSGNPGAAGAAGVIIIEEHY